ncbi:MAG: hypothetical protein JO038_08535 [Alphaproteobacteria bacterium]|nr:hypothetical protein [Alphaproteobacteria bacterium]
MRFGLKFGLATATLWLAATSAQADTVVFARSGRWEAFGGTSTNGTPVCGVSTSWPDNRYFGVKYYKGDRTITIQLGSPDWRIANGAKQRIIMQIDENAYWTGNATGMHFDDNEAGLSFDIAASELGSFVGQFRRGDNLYFSFPNTTASDWTAGLEGTNNVTSAFANCIGAM